MGHDWDAIDIARKAENLVANRVERSARRLTSRSESDSKQFGWSMLLDATKAVSLMGFGRLLQKPEYIEKGVADFANARAEELPSLPTLKADTPVSRCVIEIQQGA